MSHLQKDTDAARYVLTHPEVYHAQSAVLAGAWATLMAARGNAVNLDRIGPPAHQVVPVPTLALHDAALRSARVAERVAARHRDLASRYPTGGDAA